MNDIHSERLNSWSIYTSPDPTPSQTGVDQEGPWKNFGTSMNAILFGFVATAILISMFLVMAIFEHLFKPDASFSSPQNMTNGIPQQRRMQKFAYPQAVQSSYSNDISIVMPGQEFPTFIAQPAPLLPCQREGVCWPSHEHKLSFP